MHLRHPSIQPPCAAGCSGQRGQRARATTSTPTKSHFIYRAACHKLSTVNLPLQSLFSSQDAEQIQAAFSQGHTRACFCCACICFLFLSVCWHVKPRTRFKSVVCLCLLLVKSLCLRTRQLRCASHGVGIARACLRCGGARCSAHMRDACCICCVLCFGFWGLGVMRRAVRTIITVQQYANCVLGTCMPAWWAVSAAKRNE